MTISELYRELVDSLSATLEPREAKAAAKAILEDVRGVSQTDLVVNGSRTVEDLTVACIRKIADKINAGIPVQYAVGSARFYGMDFLVTPDVLIPRPETEGLVDLIINDFKGKSDLRVLDCGTGSGCIAISLARNLPFANIEAIDISEKALRIAKENGKRMNAKVNFRLQDILTLNNSDNNTYDIIVSNPPYIAEHEAADMDDRVKKQEPPLALFVPDDDPLRFYRAIANFATSALTENGKLYFEINPLYVEQLKQLMNQCDFYNVDVLRDYIGRYRFIRASR